MVSSISSASRRFCPVLDQAIPTSRCVSERITRIDCLLSCPFNPFNPNAPKAFDAIVGRGLTAVARWLEKTVGHSEWERRFDAMDRRFMPERDLALISFETQWSLLDRALAGDGYAELRTVLEHSEAGTLRNDARIVLQKLSQSRALLVEVTEANSALPYYGVRDVFEPEREYLYVDFGDQEPLEPGVFMFGRFLAHENCLYVIPGVFVGTQDVKDQIVEEILGFLEVDRSEVGPAMQPALPEIWNICAAVQDERDGVDDDLGVESDESLPDEPYRVEIAMLGLKSEAVLALREHPFFEEIDPPDFGIDPLGETVFDVYVTPNLSSPSEGDEEEEDPEILEDDDRSVRVGTIYVTPEKLELTALNPVELELLKALVTQIVFCN